MVAAPCLPSTPQAVKPANAVDAIAHLDRASSGAERCLDSDRRKKALVDVNAVRADFVLKPDFGYWVSLSREFRECAIEAVQWEAPAAVLWRALHAP